MSIRWHGVSVRSRAVIIGTVLLVLLALVVGDVAAWGGDLSPSGSHISGP